MRIRSGFDLKSYALRASGLGLFGAHAHAPRSGKKISGENPRSRLQTTHTHDGIPPLHNRNITYPHPHKQIVTHTLHTHTQHTKPIYIFHIYMHTQKILDFTCRPVRSSATLAMLLCCAVVNGCYFNGTNIVHSTLYTVPVLGGASFLL